MSTLSAPTSSDDDVERAQRDLLRAVDVRAGRRAQPHLELARYPTFGKISVPRLAPTKTITQRAGHGVARDDQPAQRERRARQPSRTGVGSARTPLFDGAAAGGRVLMAAQQPDRQHRHERARQQIRRDHREADRERQRDEHRAAPHRP